MKSTSVERKDSLGEMIETMINVRVRLKLDVEHKPKDEREASICAVLRVQPLHVTL